jgi:hypothetical protein
VPPRGHTENLPATALLNAADFLGFDQGTSPHTVSSDIPAVASGGAELVELHLKRLPAGADAGITDEAFSRLVSVLSFGKRKPLIWLKQATFPEAVDFCTVRRG